MNYNTNTKMRRDVFHFVIPPPLSPPSPLPPPLPSLPLAATDPWCVVSPCVGAASDPTAYRPDPCLHTGRR